MMTTPNPSYRVNKQISFALYGAASRMARMHKPYLEPLGLTFPQYLVMLELYADAPRSVGDLGTTLGMDTGTITPLLKRLEGCGMVSRTRDPGDERRVLVNITERGEDIRDEVWSITDRVKSACNMGEADLVALRDTLHSFAYPAKGNSS